MITMVQKGVLIPLSLLLAACSSQPQAGEDGSVRGYTQTGLASYYADRYHNKRTASGELHKRGGNTAAHMTLPFGTQVKVTNLAKRQERGGTGQRQGQLCQGTHHRSLQGSVQRHWQSPIRAYQGQDRGALVTGSACAGVPQYPGRRKRAIPSVRGPSSSFHW